jgi:hypothetical protein
VLEGPLELHLSALVRLSPVDLHNNAKVGQGAFVAQLKQRAVRELKLLVVVAVEEEVVTSNKVEAGLEVLGEG